MKTINLLLVISFTTLNMLSPDMDDRCAAFGGEPENASGVVTHEAITRNKLTALSETGARCLYTQKVIESQLNAKLSYSCINIDIK
jgi:hypothetical protein